MFYNYSVSLSLSPPFYVLSLEDVPFEPSTAFIPQPTPRALATVLRYSSFSFSSFASSLLIPTCIASAPKSATFFQNMIVSISLEALNSSRRQNGCIIGVTHDTNTEHDFPVGEIIMDSIPQPPMMGSRVAETTGRAIVVYNIWFYCYIFSNLGIF